MSTTIRSLFIYEFVVLFGAICDSLAAAISIAFLVFSTMSCSSELAVFYASALLSLFVTCAGTLSKLTRPDDGCNIRTLSILFD